MSQTETIFPLPACMYWEVQDYRPSSWSEHVPFAFWLVNAFNPSRFVELGTLHGMSYLGFCQAIKGLKTGTQAVAVDTWGGDLHAGALSSGALLSLKMVHDPLYSSFSLLLQSSFDDAVRDFPDQSIDLLHIDGLHTYEAVKKDFETWLPKIKKPGIILFHDTQVKDRNFGVYKFWSEVSNSRLHFEFFHGNGLGVLAIGDDFPEALRILFQSTNDPAAASAIRAKFESLGRRVSKLQLAHTLERDPFVTAYLAVRRLAGRVLRNAGLKGA